MKKILKLAKELEFEKVRDYYNYVYESYCNGNKEQYLEMMKKIKKAGRIEDMIEYLEDMHELKAHYAISYYAKYS